MCLHNSLCMCLFVRITHRSKRSKNVSSNIIYKNVNCYIGPLVRNRQMTVEEITKHIDVSWVKTYKPLHIFR